MTAWKFILMVLVFLLPGGSLLLVAWAASRAVRAGRDRLDGVEVMGQPALQPVVVVAVRGDRGG
jgi:hypothetical protein